MLQLEADTGQEIIWNFQEIPAKFRIAILSDIHANLTALKAVWQATQDCDLRIILGDLVGYGPWAKECMTQISELGVVAVLGNHDLALLGGPESVDWAQLAPRAREALRLTRQDFPSQLLLQLEQLPKRRKITLGPLQLDLAHGSWNDIWEYIETPAEAWTQLCPTEEFTLSLRGHTHVPYLYSRQTGLIEVVNNTLLPKGNYVFNPGAVGQPRDGDCRACYARIELTQEPQEVRATLCRQFYSIEKVECAIQAQGFPLENAIRLYQGR